MAGTLPGRRYWATSWKAWLRYCHPRPRTSSSSTSRATRTWGHRAQRELLGAGALRLEPAPRGLVQLRGAAGQHCTCAAPAWPPARCWTCCPSTTTCACSRPCENYMKCVSVLRFDSSRPSWPPPLRSWSPSSPSRRPALPLPARFHGRLPRVFSLPPLNPCRNGGAFAACGRLHLRLPAASWVSGAPG